MPCKSSVVLELRRIAHTYTYCIWHVNLFIHPSVAHLFYSAFQSNQHDPAGRQATDGLLDSEMSDIYCRPYRLQTGKGNRPAKRLDSVHCAINYVVSIAFATWVEVQLSLLSTKFVCVALCKAGMISISQRPTWILLIKQIASKLACVCHHIVFKVWQLQI